MCLHSLILGHVTQSRVHLVGCLDRDSKGMGVDLLCKDQRSVCHLSVHWPCPRFVDVFHEDRRGQRGLHMCWVGRKIRNVNGVRLSSLDCPKKGS